MASGLVASLQILIAFILISGTRDHLVGQIDDRLAIVMPLDRAPRLNPRPPQPPVDNVDRPQPERLGDTYEGLLLADGSLVTFFAPNSTGTELAPPEVDLDQADQASGSPLTVAAEDGDFDYRLSVVGTETGTFFITAIPLDGVDRTMSRLTTVVAVAVAIISLALALVTWWVLRLGIAPIKRMTGSAEAIADGNLSERLSDVDQRNEAGRLGHALNTMLGRIETSFIERARAEDKLRQFIADASHELRTPATTIRGYAELYQAGGLTDKAQLDDAMRRTEQESQRMSRLITDMLNLAKLDRDPTLSTRPIDVASLVLDTVADAQVTHPARSISTEVPDAPLIVEGDEDLLRQALANIVGNAIVHTGPDESVTVNLLRSGSKVVATVTDDGEGMAPDVVSRITERFYRADPSRSRHQGGSGLGLAIADSIVDAHGGSLEIASSPGHGTTVSISLPCQK